MVAAKGPGFIRTGWVVQGLLSVIPHEFPDPRTVSSELRMGHGAMARVLFAAAAWSFMVKVITTLWH